MTNRKEFLVDLGLKNKIKKRLEEIRKSIRAENVSMSELAELQVLAGCIDSSDVELLQWANVLEGTR